MAYQLDMENVLGQVQGVEKKIACVDEKSVEVLKAFLANMD